LFFLPAYLGFVSSYFGFVFSYHSYFVGTERGARAVIHPVTKYSPLYIAAYNGKKDIVEILLKKFPELINVQTVEKWLPLHAACFNGHSAVLEFLLKYKFPDDILIQFKDRTGNWKYELPFDVNQRDLSGQSVLYLACCIGNLRWGF
jgi:hypothetical protein